MKNSKNLNKKIPPIFLRPNNIGVCFNQEFKRFFKVTTFSIWVLHGRSYL